MKRVREEELVWVLQQRERELEEIVEQPKGRKQFFDGSKRQVFVVAKGESSLEV